MANGAGHKMKTYSSEASQSFATPLSLHFPMKMLPFIVFPHRQFLLGLGLYSSWCEEQSENWTQSVRI